MYWRRVSRLALIEGQKENKKEMEEKDGS